MILMIALVWHGKFGIKFIKANKKFSLRLHYNDDESYLYVNKKKICQFMAHDSTPWYEICLGNVSKDFIKNDVSENLLSGTVYYFSVDQSAIGKEDLLNIHD